MIIIVEGPEKAGKSTLVESIANGFEPNRCEIIHHSGRDKSDGFGYLRPFIGALDSPNISVWDRAWIGENVYGTLLDDGRRFAYDDFLCEWFYGRAMLGRGGKFVLLPVDSEELESRRDESDLDVLPVSEFNLFRRYAIDWGYEILVNKYDSQSLLTNTTTARRSPFVGVHKVDSTQYIGTTIPTWTFVGDTRQEFAFMNRPFYNSCSAEYFRSFGRHAIKGFGYVSTSEFEAVKRRSPRLTRNVITVGRRAGTLFPEYPNAPYSDGDTSTSKINDFTMAVQQYTRTR